MISNLKRIRVRNRTKNHKTVIKNKKIFKKFRAIQYNCKLAVTRCVGYFGILKIQKQYSCDTYSCKLVHVKAFCKPALERFHPRSK